MSKILAAEQIRLNIADLLSGTADPSAGGGLSAQIASLYLRDNASVGELWQKSGAAATSWQKLAQSFAWYSVADYGAVGDGVTDDRAAIQAAIDACVAGGGGVVYVPQGDYAVGRNGAFSLQITSDDVQLVGSGCASRIVQTGDAGGTAWSLISIAGAVSRVRIESLEIDGSGVTNATTDCHLVDVTSATGAITDVQVFRCRLTGMVAGSGDGIALRGTGGAVVSRTMVANCLIDQCGRYGISFGQAVEYLFVNGNFMTGCQAEIGCVTTASVAINSVGILCNQIVHTDASALAISIVGPAALLAGLTISQNLIIGGFVSMTNVQYGTIVGNVQTSGAFASTDAMWLFEDSVQDVTMVGNALVRSTGAGVGACIGLVGSGGSGPTRIRVGNNVFFNEVAGAEIVELTDVTLTSFGQNICRSSNAGASTVYAIDVNAEGRAVTDLLLQGNQVSAAAGTFAAATRLRAGAANITNVGIMHNYATQIAYGVEFAAPAAGTFDGKIMYAGNNADGSTGDFLNSGSAAVVPVVGLNAGTFGSQIFSGTGSPEGVVAARAGCLYLNKSGGAGATLWVKETGSGNIGWVQVGGDTLVFGTGDAGTVATALYLAPSYAAVAGATELQLTITRPGTIRNLYVRVTGAGTGTQDVTYTVRKNGVDQTLAVIVANDGAAPSVTSDLVHSFSVAAGDLVSIKITKAGAVAGGQTNVFATMEIT